MTKFIDMHCDSLMTLFYEDPVHADLYDSKVTAVDFKRMQQAGFLAQFFAIFVIPRDRYEMHHVTPISDEEYIETLYQYFEKNVREHQDIIAKAGNYQDILRNQADHKMSAVLTMEDGRTVHGDMKLLEKYYHMGIRAMNLTWNEVNCFGAPNSSNPEIMQQGLTAFGKEAVEYMQELGMLVDVSHLSDGGFYDVASICKKPFIASHSNARALCPHPRNLTDEMIRMLGESGSVTGLNLGPEFLNKDITCIDSTVELMVNHVRYMSNIGGIDCLGIGTDFDGIEGNLEVLDCSMLELVVHGLSKAGFTATEIDKICYGNVMRVIKEAMK